MTRVSADFFLYTFFPVVMLLAAGKSGAQQNSPGQVKQRLEEFNGFFVQEKLYLHTDKNFYAAGEIIWFRIYHLNGSTHRSLPLSKVAYVEIIDRSGKPALQSKVAIDAEGGKGSLYLPLTLASGYYTLRAYTNWMKNFDPRFFFEKKITVVNTIKVVSPAEPDTIRTRVQFFPESGYLVAGIATKVAFHISDNTGRGINTRGIITSDTEDSVLSFSSQRSGIGSFSFTPVAGRKYSATIFLPDGKIIKEILPEIKLTGYVMNLTDNKDDRLQIRIKKKSNNSSREEIILLVHTRQLVKAANKEWLDEDKETVVYIDKATLEEGISTITLFNASNQPVCERLVFTPPRPGKPVSITSDKNKYGLREKVNLSVAGDEFSDSSTCSVSVFQADSLQDLQQANIVSYLLLVSDLGVNIESPNFYLSQQTGAEEAADNLMLTYGWRRFKWENIFSNDRRGLIKFLPEYSGQIVSGRVINTTNGNLVADAECFLSVPSAPFGLLAARSDSNGIARFDVKNYYGPGEVIPQVNETNRNQYRIDLLSPFVTEPPSLIISSFLADKEKEDVLLQKSISMQTRNIYMPDSQRIFHTPAQQDTLPFFGKAQYSYVLDDYKRFTTMEEVLKEYVPFVNVLLKNGKLTMNVYDLGTEQVYRSGILVLLDGVPLHDYDKMFLYDPLKVKRLDVIPQKYIFGNAVYFGLVSFETYEGKFNGFTLAPDLIAVDYEGLQLQREFYSQDYSNGKQERIPDLRTTLYWQPELSTGSKQKKDIHFYTSDQKGKFIAVLEGISKKGKAFSATVSFTVE